MDDKSTSSSVGRTYEAVAVKGHRIVKLGNSGEIQALAGPDTRVLDLKGRTLIPGIIEPHMHIYGEAIRYLDRFGFEYPPNGIVVSMQAERDLEKTQALMREKIQDAVRQARPGQWVVLMISGHPEAPSEARLWGFTRRLTERKTLDLWTPENPLLVRPGPRGWVNSEALGSLERLSPGILGFHSGDHARRYHRRRHSWHRLGGQPGDGRHYLGTLSPEPALEHSGPSLEAHRGGVLLDRSDHPFHPYSFPKSHERLCHFLAGLGQMPLRLSAHYEVHRMPTDPQQTRQMYRRTGVLQGIGDDYFWIDGVASERWDSTYPESCTGPDTQAPPHIKAREVCPKPGDLMWDTLENALKAGWRLAGVHMVGSESTRAFIRMIEEARG